MACPAGLPSTDCTRGMMERLDVFMARANAAYYANHDPYADFVTSPELSQVFGELLGLWAGVVWQSLGAPSNVMLVEAGPGRGTMIKDALRAIQCALPIFGATASVHLIETSPRLTQLVAETIPEARIHTAFSTIPAGPIIFLANEFLDALPIRQFVRRTTDWAERYVESGRFVPVTTDILLPNDPPGSIRERSDVAESFISHLAERLAEQGGVGLIIDYGPIHSGPGDSLQAVRHGRPTAPLVDAGSADLTAHVDFERLARIAVASGAEIAGPITQGGFLAELGVHERTAQLARTIGPEAALNLMSATRRLTASEAMGSLFKVMAIGQTPMPPLPGFTA